MSDRIKMFIRVLGIFILLGITVPNLFGTPAKAHEDTKGIKFPILMYHCVAKYTGNGYKELYVTPSNFKAQMLYLKTAGFTPITFDELKNIQQIKKPILVTFDDGYKNNMNAFHILQSLQSDSFKPKATIFMIGRKIDTPSGLSVSELKEMSHSGIISIQSHTMTHLNLTKVSDYPTELGTIKKKLEKITGKKVIAISYPAGDYNSKVISETRKYYQYAVSTTPGFADLGYPYELKRLRVSYSTSLATFKAMVNN